jgi:hypothetical protein
MTSSSSGRGSVAVCRRSGWPKRVTGWRSARPGGGSTTRPTPRTRHRALPRNSWHARRYLWAPALGLTGIQRIHLLRGRRGARVLVLAGAGVGGGSLVYANTLYERYRGRDLARPVRHPDYGALHRRLHDWGLPRHRRHRSLAPGLRAPGSARGRRVGGVSQPGRESVADHYRPGGTGHGLLAQPRRDGPPAAAREHLSAGGAGAATASGRAGVGAGRATCFRTGPGPPTACVGSIHGVE